MLSPGETPLECQVQFWASQYKEHMEILEWVQQTATNGTKTGIFHTKSCWELDLIFLKVFSNLKILWFYDFIQLGDEKAPGILSLYVNTRWGSKEVEARLCSVMPSDRTRGSGHKQEHRKFRINIKKYIFPLDGIWH